MKSLFLFTLLLSFTAFLKAQNPSMTIAHSGLTPFDELTVYVGDSIDFFHGGGGPHPMTEGWQTGQTSTPVPFTTQTVTSGNPTVTFAINTPGIYYFHCGTNPSNSNNWGMITVLDSMATGIQDLESPFYSVYPNPVSDILTIEGLAGPVSIFDLKGKKVITINESQTDIGHLPSGIYFIGSGDKRTKIIKD